VARTLAQGGEQLMDYEYCQPLGANLRLHQQELGQDGDDDDTHTGDGQGSI
jgi:hypothetical protein